MVYIVKLSLPSKYQKIYLEKFKFWCVKIEFECQSLNVRWSWRYVHLAVIEIESSSLSQIELGCLRLSWILRYRVGELDCL